MPNDTFFETFFPHGYWQELAANTYRMSDHSFCTDGPVFSYLIELTRPQTIIEVGSWHGHSANAMADLPGARPHDANCLYRYVSGFGGALG